MRIGTTKNWLKPSSFALYMFTLICVVVAVLWLFDGKIIKQTERQVSTELSELLALKKRIFDDEIHEYKDYINFLVDTPPIQGISRATNNGDIDPKDGTTTQQWKNRLGTIFTSMMHTYGDIKQLRLIDASTGDELVRNDRYGGLVIAQPDSKLQNKAHRDYFTETIKLPERRIYASQIDLNKERGKLAFPLEPTLRIATPVFNEKNDLFAVLVANIDGQPLINKVMKSTPEHSQLQLLTSNGHFVYHPEQSLRFSQDLQPEVTWQSYYTEERWQVDPIVKVTAKKNAQDVHLVQKQELYTSSVSPAGKVWVVSTMPYERYEQLLMQHRVDSYALLAVIAIISSVGLFILWLYFRNSHQLLEARSQLADIINGASDGIIGFNKELIITSYNDAAELLFPELKKLNEPTYKVLEPDILLEFLQNTLTKVTCDKPLDSLEICIERQSTAVDLYLTVSAIHSTEGELLGFALFISDVTERNEAKAEIERINTSLELQVEQRTLELNYQKQRAEESSKVKSAFISSISHEMRTPLNGILGSLDLVRREPLSQQQKNYLDMMNTSAKTLTNLINDVLDLSKIEAGKLEIDARPFYPIQVLEHVASSVSIAALQKNIEYLLDVVDVRYLSLTGDAARVKQILYNLLNNAVKFTSKGGVYIYAATKQDDDKVWLEVSVKDTGVGIAKDKQAQMFQVFQQESKEISNEFGGTGLGLSICKQLCELMGGEIKFSSDKGKGSIFTFALPFHRADAKRLEVVPFLADKYVFLATKTQAEEDYWKKVFSLYGAKLCDLNKADFWLIDLGTELGQNLSTSPYVDSKACFIYDPVNDPLPPKNCLAAFTKPTRYIDVLATFDKETALNLFEYTSSQTKQTNLGGRFLSLVGKTVVVVDDNQINLEVARGILNTHSITSILVHSGHELLDKLNQLAAQNVDVLAILMDCNMPVMNGYEATQAVREGRGNAKYKSVPIIALTASAMLGEQEKCLACGMDEYITKPINAAILFDKLAQYCPDVSLPLSDAQVVDTCPELSNEEPTGDQQLPTLDKEAALDRLMQDASLYIKICELFKESSKARFAELQEAIDHQSVEKIKQSAHALKGQAGDVGAKQLHHLAGQLEQLAADTKHVSEYQQLHQQLEQELHSVYAQINADILNAAS